MAISLHLKSGCPSSWKISTWVCDRKGLVCKALLASVTSRLLLRDQCANLCDVFHVGIWRDEAVSFLGAVALGHIVDVNQQLLMFLFHPRPRLLLQVLQESLSKQSATFQGIWASTAGRQSPTEPFFRGQGKLVQVQVHTLWHLSPLAQLEALRHEQRTAGLRQGNTRLLLTLQCVALCQLKTVQTKLHTAIDGLQVAVATCDDVHQLTILQLDTRIATHVPKLWNLWVSFRHGGPNDVISNLIPGRIKTGFGVNQVLCHD
eukprot:Skav228655  [mRNA]  locus=scaffold2369:145103:146781:- [translate_table: standard]